MLFIDIAVPRDIESQVGELDAAYLYSVDDLQAIVSENMAAREQAAEQAQLIISERVKEFEMWVHLKRVGVVIEKCRFWCARCNQHTLSVNPFGSLPVETFYMF